MELLERVKASLRRSRGFRKEKDQEEIVLKQCEITMNCTRHEVFISKKKISLTPKEFDVLKLLMENPGKVFPREYLISKIWGADSYTDIRAVDVCVKRIREKIKVSAYVQTVWGVGYKFSTTK